jgi:hypothetical protein
MYGRVDSFMNRPGLESTVKRSINVSTGISILVANQYCKIPICVLDINRSKIKRPHGIFVPYGLSVPVPPRRLELLF